MYYWKNGKKVKQVTEKFQSTTEKAQRRKRPIREPYRSPTIEHFGKKKCPTWLYILLGCVAIAIVIVLIVWYVQSRRKGGRRSRAVESTPASGIAGEKYGFRFF